MMKKLEGVALALLAAAVLSPACGGPSDDEIQENLTPNTLTDIGVCTEVVNDQCPEDMAVIPKDAPKIYVAGRLRNATIGTVVSASLIYNEDSGPTELVNTRVTIDKVNVNLESYPVFYFTNTDLWDAGSYSVSLQLEDQNQQPIYKDFSIE
jgi:hypothetical protein